MSDGEESFPALADRTGRNRAVPPTTARADLTMRRSPHNEGGVPGPLSAVPIAATRVAVSSGFAAPTAIDTVDSSRQDCWLRRPRNNGH
jgi:hypothetical protein